MDGNGALCPPPTTEFQPALNEPNFCFAVYVLMEPPRVSPCRDQHHGNLTRALGALLDPVPYCSPVWRVTENSLATPVLRESILLLCVVLIALMIGLIRTGVECEVEFIIKLVVKLLRRSPLICLLAKHHFCVQSSVSPSNCLSIFHRKRLSVGIRFASSSSNRLSKSCTVWPSAWNVTGLSLSHFNRSAHKSG